jgi:hypothetical protein
LKRMRCLWDYYIFLSPFFGILCNNQKSFSGLNPIAQDGKN